MKTPSPCALTQSTFVTENRWQPALRTPNNNALDGRGFQFPNNSDLHQTDEDILIQFVATNMRSYKGHSINKFSDKYGLYLNDDIPLLVNKIYEADRKFMVRRLNLQLAVAAMNADAAPPQIIDVPGHKSPCDKM